MFAKAQNGNKSKLLIAVIIVNKVNSSVNLVCRQTVKSMNV